mmetsp:Transcript_34903/g.56485  ORF Transcript_34903/g.56485 Transcript_34903/m.56485 type:complete len:183 (-) Transcript_34903:341-889(-)
MFVAKTMEPLPLPQKNTTIPEGMIGLIGPQLLSGDLFESPCSLVIHCCNCFCRFGAGIALQFAKKYPEAAAVDQATTKGDREKLGTFTAALSADGSRTIVNLYAQYMYGRPKDKDGNHVRRVEYDALRRGLESLLTQLREKNATPLIGTYFLGCGAAGGDRSEVWRIFQELFTDRPLLVYDI